MTEADIIALNAYGKSKDIAAGFDRGINRDAGYIYRPMRPRTVFIGLKFGLN